MFIQQDVPLKLFSLILSMCLKITEAEIIIGSEFADIPQPQITLGLKKVKVSSSNRHVLM